MENTNDILQGNIQAFVNGELDEKARRSLLEQAQTDPLVADELGFSQNLAYALRNHDLLAASAILNAVINEEGFPPSPSPTAKHGGKWWVWTSLAIVLLLTLTGGYFWAEKTGLLDSKTQKIGRSVLEPLENVLFLPTNGQALADLQAGMAAYESRQYDKAAQLLGQYVGQNPDNAARVYFGVAQLMSGKARTAIGAFAIAAQSQEPPIQEAALWYMALAYLDTDNADAAIQALESIPPDGIYGQQAQDLLKKLN